MTLDLSNEKLDMVDEVQLSYYVSHKSRKYSRVGHAKLIDLSAAGLCMEISPYDSDLFLESQGKLFIMSTEVELQIFCRSHPINVSVTGSIRWFKRKKELGEVNDSENIYVGVMFPFVVGEQKQSMLNLVRHLKSEMVKCSECGATVSAEAFLCYNCGSKPVRRRNILKKVIFSFLNGNNENSSPAGA